MFLGICRAYLNLHFVRHNDFNFDTLQTSYRFLCIVLCHDFFSYYYRFKPAHSDKLQRCRYI